MRKFYVRAGKTTGPVSSRFLVNILKACGYEITRQDGTAIEATRENPSNPNDTRPVHQVWFRCEAGRDA